MVPNTVNLKGRKMLGKGIKTNGSQADSLLPVPICPAPYSTHKKIEVWRKQLNCSGSIGQLLPVSELSCLPGAVISRRESCKRNRLGEKKTY